MAKVVACKKPGIWEFDAFEAQKPRGQRADDKAFTALQDKSDAVDMAKTLVGLVVSFPWADGFAHYKVVKQKPLTLEHIPYTDAWRLPSYAEEGLNVIDITERVLWCRATWKRAKVQG